MSLLYPDGNEPRSSFGSGTRSPSSFSASATWSYDASVRSPGTSPEFSRAATRESVRELAPNEQHQYCHQQGPSPTPKPVASSSVVRISIGDREASLCRQCFTKDVSHNGGLLSQEPRMLAPEGEDPVIGIQPREMTKELGKKRVMFERLHWQCPNCSARWYTYDYYFHRLDGEKIRHFNQQRSKYFEHLKKLVFKILPFPFSGNMPADTPPCSTLERQLRGPDPADHPSFEDVSPMESAPAPDVAPNTESETHISPHPLEHSVFGKSLTELPEDESFFGDMIDMESDPWNAHKTILTDTDSSLGAMRWRGDNNVELDSSAEHSAQQVVQSSRSQELLWQNTSSSLGPQQLECNGPTHQYSSDQISPPQETETISPEPPQDSASSRKRQAEPMAAPYYGPSQDGKRAIKRLTSQQTQAKPNARPMDHTLFEHNRLYGSCDVCRQRKATCPWDHPKQRNTPTSIQSHDATISSPSS